ncbi:hypothetical protein Sru01_38000 [Sphaerisporangium rufum]|uniref:Uncharacterized protein n=1 Tax=Sphaerisporangium rufum TaxID=1381558 RepID=A0A919R495_9ACTN|nr:hypothetical protein Sru01_38000 [Sphaerisporangium rufum]
MPRVPKDAGHGTHAGERSPLGGMHNVAPAGRYSTKAVGEARGLELTGTSDNPDPPAGIPAGAIISANLGGNGRRACQSGRRTAAKYLCP